MIDSTLLSIRERFSQLLKFSELFGFLYSSTNLIEAHKSGTLSEDCNRFSLKTEDVEAAELLGESVRFVNVVKEKNLVTPQEMLQYLYANNLEFNYANLANLAIDCASECCNCRAEL